MKTFHAIFSSGLVIEFEARDQIHAEVRAHHTAVALVEHLDDVQKIGSVVGIQSEAA